MTTPILAVSFVLPQAAANFQEVQWIRWCTEFSTEWAKLLRVWSNPFSNCASLGIENAVF
ncbi:hypothetical protein [Verminephrobacter aporrectodeae]|nr:hypothetical protein [Verminephrobacter aporrectodeae]